MQIEISIESHDPPAGRVRVDPSGSGSGTAFVGWLGLLRALERVIESPAAPGRDPDG